jgi:hypothetical protein
MNTGAIRPQFRKTPGVWFSLRNFSFTPPLQRGVSALVLGTENRLVSDFALLS